MNTQLCIIDQDGIVNSRLSRWTDITRRKLSNFVVDSIVEPRPIEGKRYQLRYVDDKLEWWQRDTPTEENPNTEWSKLIENWKLVAIQRVAQLRWERETAGIILNGFRIPTDDRSKTLLAGKVIRAQIDPELTCRWKTSDGQWITLSAVEIIGMGVAVDQHVQACFDNEGDLVDDILAAENPNDVDIHSGWPE